MPLGGPRLRTTENRSNQSGLRIREKRQELKLGQDALCGRIALVTSGNWIPDRLEVMRIEQGTRLVSDLELLALAASLECSPLYLLGVPEKVVHSSPHPLFIVPTDE
jgi:transcriptional regulator with XRE-family HTH domain